MIYITGDTHGVYNDLMYRIEKYSLGEDDILIVCGDFGFVKREDVYNYCLDKLSRLPFTIAFADGNHENFDLIEAYPVQEWNGGKVHQISENIFHMMRGQLFTIEDRTFFTMGGAYSIDKAFRREGISWWKQELPTNEDYKTASDTLKKCYYTVDYIITHTLPESVIYALGYFPDMHDRELTGFFEWLRGRAGFKYWFGGHFHVDKKIGNNYVLYEDVVKLNDIE